MLSCGAALVTSLYGEERRGRALGIYTMMMALGLMLGPLIGGALTAIWDWPAVFWFRIPIAIAALVLLRGMPASPPRAAGDRIDILGGIALVLGLVTLLMALNRIREFSAVWLGCAIRARLCRLYLPPIPRGASDHRAGGFSPAGLCVAQSRQRAGQYRGLFGLAAGALLSGARARILAGGKRRHPGCGRGRRRAGRTDRRPPHRTAEFPPSGWRLQALSELAAVCCC